MPGLLRKMAWSHHACGCDLENSPNLNKLRPADCSHRRLTSKENADVGGSRAAEQSRQGSPVSAQVTSNVYRGWPFGGKDTVRCSGPEAYAPCEEYLEFSCKRHMSKLEKRRKGATKRTLA